MVGSPDYEVGVRDLGTHPERVVPLVRGAPWPRGVDAAQVYPSRVKEISRLDFL